MRKKNGKTQHFVHWTGFPTSQNSWINESDMEEKVEEPI